MARKRGVRIEVIMEDSKVWGFGSWKGGVPLKEWGEWEQVLCLVMHN